MSVLDLPSWTPQVQDVANHLLNRTRQTNGDYAGTFNSLTFPTDVMVVNIINQELAILRPKLGDVPDFLADAATALIACKAACEVEESCFSEQVMAGQSRHPALKKKYDEGLRLFLEAAAGDVPNGYRTASLACGTLYPAYATGTY